MTPIDPKRRQEIIEKIRACFNRADVTRGATQAEAETSIKMAKRLMADYNLSQSEVELSTTDDGTTGDQVTEDGVETYTRFWPFELTLTHVCKNLFNVRPLQKYVWDKETGKNRKVIVFIGYSVDVALAQEVYGILRDDVLNLEKTLGTKVSNNDKSHYRSGIVSSLAERSKEIAAGLNVAQQEKCTALVVVKDKVVQTWMNKAYPNLSHSRGYQPMSGAFMAGKADGAKISLNFGKRLR